MNIQGLTILEGKDAPRMAERTTIRLGGPVLAEVRLADMRAVDALPEIAKRLGGTLTALGSGSNILAAEKELPIVLVRDTAPMEFTILDEDASSVTLRTGCGGKLPVLLSRLAKKGLAGLEGLSGIPGSIGGAIAMNAGSFGQSFGDCVVALDVAVPGRGVLSVPREEIDFSYRHMALPTITGWYMFAGVTLKLARASEESIEATMRANMTKKKATQPVTAFSAGCVFKNPSPEQPAGKLLDELGFKGKHVGGMVFSTLHANFMLNDGSGTSDEAFELLHMACEAVQQTYGITLENEVQLWV